MTKSIIFSGILALVCGVTTLTAQVTIGSHDSPQDFSVLELISNNTRGLRLPQMDSVQRKAMQATAAFQAAKTGAAMGLQIFNTSTKCIEIWNGAKWIAQCAPHINDSIPSGQGGDSWGTTNWVGAFWRDNQTGERIITSKNTASVTWSAVVDDPNGTGSWLTLEASGGNDPNLWTAMPDDAENHQLPFGRVTTVSGTGDILFRIGVTGTDTRTASANYKYPDGNNGKPPRYATVTLTVSGTNYKLYCRQGEAADYVFTPADTYTDPNAGNTGIARSLAKKFSPYNLTNTDITESTASGIATGVATTPATYKGAFVDFPTKAGAHFQWGMLEKITYAWHPTNPTTGTVSSWGWDYYRGYWDAIKGAQETCPGGWRRPNDGVTDVFQTQSSTSNYMDNNIYKSEMRQSLYAVPKNGRDAMSETTGIAFGYYADGYFDRHPVVTSVSTYSPRGNSAVSVSSKEAAYTGMLFFNSANGNRSLFMPAAGLRHSSTNLLSQGGSGAYWSSSSNNGPNDVDSWGLRFSSGSATEWIDEKIMGFSVRCVSE